MLKITFGKIIWKLLILTKFYLFYSPSSQFYLRFNIQFRICLSSCSRIKVLTVRDIQNNWDWVSTLLEKWTNSTLAGGVYSAWSVLLEPCPALIVRRVDYTVLLPPPRHTTHFANIVLRNQTNDILQTTLIYPLRWRWMTY